MKMILILLAIGILSPMSALAGSQANNAQITQLSINEAYGGTYVFIMLSVTPTQQPTCATNGAWSYTFPFSAPGANQVYAMLLSAYTAGSTVDMVGTGTCNEFGQIESLQALSLVQ